MGLTTIKMELGGGRGRTLIEPKATSSREELTNRNKIVTIINEKTWCGNTRSITIDHHSRD